MMKNLILYYSRKEENYAGGSIIRLEKGNTCLLYTSRCV